MSVSQEREEAVSYGDTLRPDSAAHSSLSLNNMDDIDGWVKVYLGLHCLHRLHGYIIITITSIIIIIIIKDLFNEDKIILIFL